MKRSWLAITPLILTSLVACAREDVSSVGSIGTVTASTAYAPADTGPTPTVAAVTTPAPATVAATTAAPVATTAAPATTAGGALPTADCLARLQEASALDPEDTIEAFYPSLQECTGLADWLAAVEVTGFDPGEDPTKWAAQVCGLDGPMLAITCQEAMATAQAG